ncbi:hypothetical protein MMC29_003195 [Sticta canariensis]|nr:hypothetical protein [Sticta canariensis]
MSILRIPDIAGAVSQMKIDVHPDEVEVTQAMYEWFTSGLTHDESGAAEATRIMLSVLSDTDNFQPTPSLLVAATSHQYVSQPLNLSRLLWHKRASLM